LAFLRLRITNSWTLPILKNSALIRELHTYGQTVPVSEKIKNAQQHQRLGKRLMAEAEKIVRKEFNKKTCTEPCRSIAVISGIGVRDYYRKLGYKLKNEYMIKNL
jgi:elongator complex protein 3